MSHSDKILAYLKVGNPLTALEALHLFGCFRLSARIKDLRNSGHKINSEMVKLPNNKHVAQYTYEGDANENA